MKTSSNFLNLFRYYEWKITRVLTIYFVWKFHSTSLYLSVPCCFSINHSENFWRNTSSLLFKTRINIRHSKSRFRRQKERVSRQSIWLRLEEQTTAIATMLKTRHRYSMPAQEARLSIYYSQTTAYDGDNAQGKRNFAFRCTDELRAKKRVGRTLFTRCIAIAGAMPGRKTRPFESSNQSGHVEKKWKAHLAPIYRAR